MQHGNETDKWTGLLARSGTCKAVQAVRAVHMPHLAVREVQGPELALELHVTSL